MTKGQIALSILKNGFQIRTVDLFFFPIRVQSLLHISRITPESYFVNNFRMDHPHHCHLSHIGCMIFDTQPIVNLRDGRQCRYLKNGCKLLWN